VNPHHHRLGLRQNVQNELIKRDRKKRGEQHPRAALTESDVLAILHSYRADGASQYRLAKDYGVAISTIFNITHGETWNHVTKLPRLNYNNNYVKQRARVSKPPTVRFRD